MNKPKEFIVFYNGKHFETNNEQLAHKKAIAYGGTVYIDTRYNAKVRLFNYLNRIK